MEQLSITSKISRFLFLFAFCLILCINALAADYTKEKPSHVWKGSLTEKEINVLPEQLVEKLRKINKEEYAKISASDNIRIGSTSTDSQAGYGYPCILYEFKIRYKGNITIIWEGYGVQPFEKIQRYALLYLWNYSANRWDLLVNSSFGAINNSTTWNTEEKTILINITAFPYYIKKDHLYLLAMGPYGAGYSSGYLENDYVAIEHEIKVTAPSPIYIAIFAMLFIALFKMWKQRFRE